MFTGIVEEVGTIRSLQLRGNSGSISIVADKVLEGTKIGDSIAVNGICLTVTSLLSDGFTADVMAETVRRSGLDQAKQGDLVNLERAMAADGRFGGHIVSGHIDGISLTVATVSDSSFQVSVIPHTAEETTLIRKHIGDVVNLENDVVGKYVQRLLEGAPLKTQAKTKSTLTMETLQELGF